MFLQINLFTQTSKNIIRRNSKHSTILPISVIILCTQHNNSFDIFLYITNLFTQLSMCERDL